MILSDRKALLAYFNVRSLPALERQFNRDGRLVPLMLDTRHPNLLIATGPKQAHEVVNTMTFPMHVSDLLGQIERDRIAAERLAGL